MPSKRYNKFPTGTKTMTADTIEKLIPIVKKNQEIYKKIYSILENNDLKNFLKAYKLFIYYEDDNEMINKIKTNTLVKTVQFDVILIAPHSCLDGC